MTTLSRLVRQMGWEDLVDVPLALETPDTAADLPVETSRTRDLVVQLTRLVQDLGSVEVELLFSADDVEAINFKPDPGLDERRFVHGLRLDRQLMQQRHLVFAETLKALRTLEDRFDDAD